jgi:diguanylate cyclase (GGDEF)-like protein
MFRQLSIKNKLTLIITLVTTTALILGFTGITLTYYNETRSNLIKSIEHEAKLVANYSQVPVALDFHDDLKRILNDVTISSAHTSAICDREPSQIIQADNGGGRLTDKSDCYLKGPLWQDKWLWVTETIYDISGELIGLVILKVSTADFNATINRFAYLALIFTALSIGFSFFLAGRLQTYISRPITDLKEATQQLCNQENYNFRVPVTSDDDIGSLSLSFNRMLEAMEHRLVERNQAITKMHLLANYDPLTKLPNRTLCLDRLEQAISKVSRDQETLAIMFIDLDNFKDVNDFLGHSAGDLLLVKVSNNLSNALRQSDTLARLGGDEFVVILTEFESKESLSMIAEKCVQAVSQEFKIMDNIVTTSASIGIAIYPDDAFSSEELMKAADSAMYQAKAKGKNAFYFYEERINAILARRHTLAGALRFALKEQQLHVEYQPVVELSSNKIVGAEALIRWKHPDFGMISPAEFIPIAESTGLILPISLFVVESVCQFIAKFRAELSDNFSVALNLSPAILRQSSLVTQIEVFLNQYEVPAKAVCFEVTENALMNEMEHCIQTLNALKKLGSRISIDDFGTGYSSLSYLSKLPVDNLKIDRSFINDMLHDSNDTAITLAIISLAQSLDLKVIAEGVEDQAQLKFLKKHNCEYIQGFLVSPSKPDRAFTSFLKSYNL